MQQSPNHATWSRSRWTLAIALGVTVINADLCFSTWSVTSELARALEFDGVAIRNGEVWRVLTGNLVHWNREHLFLDVGVFLVLGIVFERSMGRSYPWLLLLTALASGIAGLALWEPHTRCRGLSGVDSGLFAAALVIEWRLAFRDRTRWLWVAPATMLFALKNGVELSTGRSFFGTEQLLGPTCLAVAAHTAAILAAILFCGALVVLSQQKQ
jgi:rhomboid family GlyGly-CTERM serine protease